MIKVMDRLDEMTSYHNEYRSRGEGEIFETVSIADVLAEWIEELRAGPQRWEVLNRCERTPISSLKRAIIHERDGHRCIYCGTGGHILTVDHVIPRSAFPSHMLHIADRSDNLVSACWPCNEKKSNYGTIKSKKLGVTKVCWECENPAPEADDDWEACAAWGERAAVSRNHHVYCGRCGHGASIPDLTWVL